MGAISNLNYFPELEAAAERVVALGHLDRSDMYRSLAGFLRDREGIEVVLTPVSRDGGVIRRFDPDRRLLSISEVLPPWSRNFQIAHQIGLLDAQDAIHRVIENNEKHLTAPESQRLCRVALANYFAAALLMPYDEFIRCTVEMRYDVELLQHHFTASWEQVCHRLTTLRKPEAMGVPFHFVRVDIAGNISKRFSGTGTVRDARKLVYADGVDLENLDAAVPIGTTCRLCERLDCDQRAFPALQFGMTIDENVRGRSFFAPAVR